MSAVKPFVDSNVVLYLLSADVAKAEHAEAVLASGGVISVQVLNEVTNVARRRAGLSWAEIAELLDVLERSCVVEALTINTHNRGLQLAERYSLSVYDAMIVAAALLAGCGTLFSEDLQHGLLIDEQLRICNPFLT